MPGLVTDQAFPEPGTKREVKMIRGLFQEIGIKNSSSSLEHGPSKRIHININIAVVKRWQRTLSYCAGWSESQPLFVHLLFIHRSILNLAQGEMILTFPTHYTLFRRT